MTEGIADWMKHNPRLLWAMGVPVLLFLGHTFLQNDTARIACGIVAACAMVAVTVMAVLTARWGDLIWPCIGCIAWSAMAGVRKAVG
ncbi:hypothetical protein ACFLSJ_00585 [Verrucomicrobiota bacterium]